MSFAWDASIFAIIFAKHMKVKCSFLTLSQSCNVSLEDGSYNNMLTSSRMPLSPFKLFIIQGQIHIHQDRAADFPCCLYCTQWWHKDCNTYMEKPIFICRIPVWWLQAFLGFAHNPCNPLPEPFPILSPLLCSIYVGRALIIGGRQHRNNGQHDGFNLQATNTLRDKLLHTSIASCLWACKHPINAKFGSRSEQTECQYLKSLCCVAYWLHRRPSFSCSLIAMRIISSGVQYGYANPAILVHCNANHIFRVYKR